MSFVNQIRPVAFPTEQLVSF